MPEMVLPGVPYPPSGPHCLQIIEDMRDVTEAATHRVPSRELALLSKAYRYPHRMC